MGFRSDHEAALARADALEREIDEAEAAREDAEELAEARETELADARAEIARLRAQVPAMTPTPPPKRRSTKKPAKKEPVEVEGEYKRIKLTKLQRQHHKTDKEYILVPLSDRELRDRRGREGRGTTIALGVAGILAAILYVFILLL